MRHSKAFAALLVGMGWTAVIAGLAVVVPLGIGIGLMVLGAVLMVAGAVIWRRGEPQPPKPAPDPRNELKAALSEVDSVRTWLNLREDPNARLPLDEDRVFQWAKKTYQIIASKYPEDADAFMGESDAELGSPYFALAYGIRRGEMGRDGYLESRAAIVREILRRTR